MDAASLLTALKRGGYGKIFTVRFVKRTTGEVRVMNCRLGVKKGVTGAGMAFDPAERKLLPVFDMQKRAFRMISLDSVIDFTVAGATTTTEEK